MKNLFSKNKIYSENNLNKVANANDMTTVDCLKDEKMISLEKFENGELGGECLFEFDRVGEDKFLLKWSGVEK